MRHHTTTVAVLLTAGLALTACSGSSHNDKPAPTTTPATATADPKAQFLAAAHAANLASWAEKAPTDTELAPFPVEWCENLNQGHSVAWILGQDDLYPIGQDWGTANPDAEKLVLLGATYYCPDKKGQVEAELRAAGDY